MRSTTALYAIVLAFALITTNCGKERSNPDDSAVLKDFQDRVDRYVELQKTAEGGAPIKPTRDPAEINAYEDALAYKVRALRPNAKQGEIFTPAIQKKFRQLLYPELKGSNADEIKHTLQEDEPPDVPLRVNAKYSETEPLLTVPPQILLRLPQLPEELEYRIVRRHLILRDVHANLIVDYIPNIIRPSAG